MKKITYIFLVILSSTLFNACLKSGLDDLPAFEEAEITDFQFEYRWIAGERLWTKQLNNTLTIDEAAGTITNLLTVPDADPNGPDDPEPVFTEQEKANVSLGTIAAYATLSTAATMKPTGDSPAMGVPGFAASAQYEVTAADGKTKKTWTVNTTIQ